LPLKNKINQFFIPFICCRLGRSKIKKNKRKGEREREKNKGKTKRIQEKKNKKSERIAL